MSPTVTPKLSSRAAPGSTSTTATTTRRIGGGGHTSASSAAGAKTSVPETTREQADNNETHESLTVSSSSSNRRLSGGAAPALAKKTFVRPKIEAKRKDIKTPPPTNNNAESERVGSSSSAGSSHLVKAHPMPSALVNKHKQAPMWSSGKKKHMTNFGAAYDAGEVPCRINHGSIKNSLQWTKEPETLAFDPLLIKCVDGFQETQHPFVFLARECFRQLMKVEDAREKVVPILPKVIASLRAALMSKDDDTFLMALEATRILSEVVEDELNEFLPKLLQQIHRKLLSKTSRSQVEATLESLEQNGGKEALAIIHTKIPTYVSLG